jgi:hypothetical protein
LRVETDVLGVGDDRQIEDDGANELLGVPVDSPVSVLVGDDDLISVGVRRIVNRRVVRIP